MKAIGYLIQGCAVALILGSTLSVNAQGYYPSNPHHFKRMGVISNFGFINPGQKLMLSVPRNVMPGSMAVCWSRNLMAGKIKINVPQYGSLMLTPHNPVARFAIPAGGQFSAKYETGGGLFHRGTRNYRPAQLVCKF